VVGIHHNRFECLLAKPVRRQPRATEHRPGPVPRLSQVQLYRHADKALQQLTEIGSQRAIRQVVPLPLHDVGSETGRRCHGVHTEEPGIPDQHASDFWVLTRGHRVVLGDLGAQVGQAISAVPRTQQFPGVRYSHRDETAEEAAADDPVVRVMALEEERLTRLKRTEGMPTTRPPEVDLGQVRPGSQEPVPPPVRDAYVCAHADQLPNTFCRCQSRYLCAGIWAPDGSSNTSRSGGRP
jgi:hypothetical protein